MTRETILYSSDSKGTWQQILSNRTIASERRETIFLVALIMCSINFFELQMIKGTAFRYVQFLYLLGATIVSLPYIFSKKTGFILPVQLIFFSVSLSMGIASYNWDQSIIDSLGGTVPVLIWATFFYINRLNITLDKVEWILIGYGILYLILYFFQFTHPNTGYFIKLETLDTSRGILRIVFPGRGLFYLSTFIAITKLTTTKKNRILWIGLGLMGIIVTIMQVTRQFIFAAAVIYLIHFLWTSVWYKKILIISASLALLVYISVSDHEIVTSMKETQEQNTELGAEYVRVQGAIFYLTEFPKNEFARIFGNGVPYGDNSSYNKYYSWLLSNYGYWLSDVGLIAVYAMFGIFAVLGYLLIWIKSIVIKVPKEYLYVKYYLWFLLLTCLTSDTVYSPSDLIATVIAVSIFQSLHEKRQYFENLPIIEHTLSNFSGNINRSEI